MPESRVEAPTRSNPQSRDQPGLAWLVLNSVAIRALNRKYAVPILLALHERGVLRTRSLVRHIGAHAATVIDTVRALEDSQIVSRTRTPRDRRAVEIRLTAQGLELVETAMSHWRSLIRKWDRL